MLENPLGDRLRATAVAEPPTRQRRQMIQDRSLVRSSLGSLRQQIGLNAKSGFSGWQSYHAKGGVLLLLQEQ